MTSPDTVRTTGGRRQDEFVDERLGANSGVTLQLHPAGGVVLRMTRSARFILFVLAGLAACGVIVLGALAALVLALGTSVLAASQAAVAKVSGQQPREAHQPVAKLRLAA